MLTLRDVIDDLFMCLGPLRACQEPIEDRCVDPVQERIIDPLRDNCVDPIQQALEINPLGFSPAFGTKPSLPQFNTPSQQDSRAAQLGRTKPNYQYNYSLVRTFRVEDRGGRRVGVQGRGIAVLDALPFSQLPSIFWLMLVVQHALVLLDNLLTVLDVLGQPSRRQKHARSKAVAGAAGRAAVTAGGEPDLTAVAMDDITPEEVERQKEDVRELRRNLLGTLTWSRQIVRKLEDGNDNDVEQRLQSLTPAEDYRTFERSELCPCLRCSPQNFTKEMFEDLKAQLSLLVEKILLLPGINKRPRSVRAYNDLFQRVPLPSFALTFQSDEVFALQRIAGQNPVVLERIEWTGEWAKKFPVTAAQYSRVMGDKDKLQSAGQEGRLYICDYQVSLGNALAGDFPFKRQKYIFAPLALFALAANDRSVIKAVAIQIGQEPAADNPIITPDDGWNWEIAKTIVQNSDCNDSEFYRHLGRGHLLSEAFGLATYRQLPRQHPLYVLLTPHFDNMFATNNTAITSINEENTFLNVTNAIFSGTIPSTLGIAGNAVSTVNFTANMLPNDLRRRGVDDSELLPNYPFREDALLIWNTIHQWVDDYVGLYYQSDDDVVGDYELQNWVLEVSSRNGGRIQGVGDNGVGGRIATIDYLIDCITEVIYLAGPHHALTNFPLEDYEIYSPGWPGALYRDAPKKAKGATRRDWLEYLAPLNVSLLQQALGYTVGGVYFTKLGRYPLCHFADARVRIPLLKFQKELSRVEETINERNQTRPLRYPYLLPSRIPQSTNI
jgi:arachidonate 15-lipoxygenase